MERKVIDERSNQKDKKRVAKAENFVLKQIYHLMKDYAKSQYSYWSYKILKFAISENEFFKPKILATTRCYKKFYHQTMRDIREFTSAINDGTNNYCLIVMVSVGDIIDRLRYEFEKGVLTKKRIKVLLGERIWCWALREEIPEVISDPPIPYDSIFKDWMWANIEIYENDIRKLDENYEELVKPLKMAYTPFWMVIKNIQKEKKDGRKQKTRRKRTEFYL